MRTLEEISAMILDGSLEHSTTNGLPKNQNGSDDWFDELSNENAYLEHYGVLGMKWGVRKDKKPKYAKVKKQDLRYENETDQEYQARMNREFQERTTNTRASTDSASNKTQRMQLKSQERMQKRQLRSQEKIKKMEIDQANKDRKIRESQEKRAKAEEARKAKQAKKQAKEEEKKTKSKPTNARNLTDRELSDAINRLRNEQTYKQLSLEQKGLPTKTLVKAATIGGGILIAVGTSVAKKQLTSIGNEKAEDYLKRKGILKGSSSNSSKQGFNMDDMQEMISEVVKSKK